MNAEKIKELRELVATVRGGAPQSRQVSTYWLAGLLDEVEALTNALVLIRDSTFRNSVTLRGIADNALSARHEPKDAE